MDLSIFKPGVKGVAIGRINFIAHGRGALTYKNLLLIVVAWCALLALFYGVQILRQMHVRRGIAEGKAAVEKLNEQKDRQIELMEAISRQSLGLSVRKDLAGILESRPLWSRTLRKLTRSLPPQVWLESVSVETEKDGTEMMEVRGKTKSQRALTNFILQLEKGKSFQKTKLVGTQRISGSEGLFSYELKTYPIGVVF